MRIFTNLLIVAVFGISFAAFVGHLFNLPFMYDWGFKTASTRLLCSINFMMVGIIMLATENSDRRFFQSLQAMFSSFLFIACLTEALILFLYIFAPHTAEETSLDYAKMLSALPSPMTLLALTAISILSFIFVFNDRKKMLIAKIVCGLIMFEAFSALMGHFTEMSNFFFYFQVIDNGVAVPTAVMLLFSSVYFSLNLSTIKGFEIKLPELKSLQNYDYIKHQANG